MKRSWIRRSGKPLKRAFMKAGRKRLRQIGRARSKTMSDGRERLTGADYQVRRREVYDRDQGRCQMVIATIRLPEGSVEVKCLRRVKFEDAEIDHVITRSRGRDDRATNLRTTCGFCHRKRHEAERALQFSNSK